MVRYFFNSPALDCHLHIQQIYDNRRGGPFPSTEGELNCAGRQCIGGAEGIRTPDLDNANVALSQLSYGPVNHSCIV